MKTLTGVFYVLQQMREDIDELERLRDEYMQKNKEQVGLHPFCFPPSPPIFLSLPRMYIWTRPFEAEFPEGGILLKTNSF